MSMHHNNTNNRHRGSFHDGGDVDLGALYAGAVECARKEVELAAMCFAYRAKRADRPRHEVSGKILRALEAAGCAGRNKVCACSLGMFECFKVRFLSFFLHPTPRTQAFPFSHPIFCFANPLQVRGHVEHFGDWTGGLRADDGFAELTRRAVSRLQARHDEALRAAGSDRRELSITRLYGVFVEVRRLCADHPRRLIQPHHPSGPRGAGRRASRRPSQKRWRAWRTRRGTGRLFPQQRERA